MKDAEFYAKKFKLIMHPEGGMFREFYRADLILETNALPAAYGAPRSCSTSIFYLLKGADFSAFHKILSDEIWYYHAGEGAFLYCIFPDGSLINYRLSADDHPEAQLQVVMPGGCWFAAKPISETGYILAGCMVAPGFDFADFTLANRTDLKKLFPQHTELIERFTR